MKKLLLLFVTCIAMMSACSGSSGTSTNGRIIGGPGDSSSSSSSSSAATVLSLGNGVGVGFTPGLIALSSNSLAAGGSATLSVTLVDQNGLPYLQSTVLTFSSSCITLGRALIQDGNGNTISSITTTSGSATATYVARGCSGPDVITASTTANNQSLTATATITVQSAQLGQVVFTSASPTVIGLKGTGIQETSTLTFQVLDSTNGPVNGAAVTFALSTSLGGVSLSTTTATSGADGKVQTVVKSGTVHTTVSVTATATFNGVMQSTQSNNLSISTGIPTTAGFSLAPVCPNIEAFDYDGVQSIVAVRLADRYSNPVRDNTAVSFTTEGGKIDGQCTTTTTASESGVCSVNWTSQNPRPTNGRVTILATTLGEDSFTDSNFNGFLDAGEVYDDFGEPFEDDNENGNHDPGERLVDVNNNGVRDATYGSFKGITCTGTSPTSTCTLTTAPIGGRALIVMSTSQAQIAQSPLTVPPSGFDAAVAVDYNVKDLKGNAMPNGTTITVTANTAAGTLDEPTTFKIPCDWGTSGFDFTANLVRPASGTSLAGAAITVTVTSPAGLVTTHKTMIN